MRKMIGVILCAVSISSIASECNNEVCLTNKWKENACADSSNKKRCIESINYIIQDSYYQGALALYCKEKKDGIKDDPTMVEKCKNANEFIQLTTDKNN
ncbi:hypothetical protein [Providencia sp. PROV266]|uniref:hypothetical protein n=1 Tax=Providencia sp. PROV266 TaxID=2949954 RepID=UPI00234BFE09|nr:hypothetical protein [Providencia sp. PROV266]